MYIEWFPMLCFYGISVCENLCVSVCIFPLSCLFVLSYYNLFVFIILFLDAYYYHEDEAAAR